MKKLICNGNELEVKDYLIRERVCTLDLQYKSKEDFDRFLTIYEKYGEGKGIFNFEIEGNKFEGWFDSMLYDRAYNVRVHIGICDGNEELEIESEGKTYSIGRSLLGIGKSVRKLCNVLSEKGLLSKEQLNEIIREMDTPESMIELRYLVNDLPMYLKSNNTLLEDLKKQ